MIRQNIKDQEYFNNYFEACKSQIKRRKSLISNDLVKADRLVWFRKSNLVILLNYVIAKYTSGINISDLENILIETINSINENWATEVVLLNYEGRLYNQYTGSNYDEMLWMLSLSYLLDIANEDFQKLVDVIDRDCVKDFLFEFIIRNKIKDRPLITEESYQEFFGIPKIYEKLRQAITEIDKTKAEKLVKDFMTKDWYKNHKELGWYNSHKSPHNTYFGYWSFETAAIVKIMELNDSNFRDCQYYPKDLVNY